MSFPLVSLAVLMTSAPAPQSEPVPATGIHLAMDASVATALADSQPSIATSGAALTTVAVTDAAATDTVMAEAVEDPDQTAQNEVTVTGRPEPTPGDPLEKLNAQSFEVIQKVDDILVGPVAMSYKRNIPSPIRSGLRNFLRNLAEPIVFLNYMLQIKPGKAAETAGRFAINSTAGAFGLMDIAKRPNVNLPYRPNGFANTMGYYGIKPGPFLFLPLVGATTLRDVIGNTLDRLLIPTVVGRPFNDPAYAIPANVIGLIDSRAEFDDQLQIIKEGNADPYAASRSYYLRMRQAEIDALRGKKAPPTQPPPVVPTLEPVAPEPLAPEPVAAVPDQPIR